MKKICVLFGALFCWSGIVMARGSYLDSLRQVVLTDTLLAPIVLDSLSVVPDTMLVMSDTLSLVSDSLAIDSTASDSLKESLDVLEVDSTALVLEKVKELTDMISAKSLFDSQLVKDVFSDTAIVNKYNRLLDKMVREYAVEVEKLTYSDSSDVNPLYFRLFAPLTLYKSPVNSAMHIQKDSVWVLEDSLRLAAMTSGRDLRLVNELDRVLLSTYLSAPTQVLLTEDDLLASQSVSEDAIRSTAGNAALNVPAALAIPLADTQKAELNTNMVVSKPNFWKTLGNFSTQMTESFFSPNWYQGGTNNINVLSTMRLEANYNNKKKTQWDNKLEARVGFYQNYREEGADPIQSNQDLLRLTSKLNLRAIRSWNYAIEAQGETQMMQHFNGTSLQSRFMTPFNGSLTVGMDYKKNFKKGSLSIFPGPLSYKMTYVAVKDLAASYGVEKGRIRNDIGSKLQVDFNYQITKNISYRTRFYYYTPYDYVQMDWENTFNFQVSKYISTTLFFHTRFDDHVVRNDNWGFLQFKEYLTFGLNYSW